MKRGRKSGAVHVAVCSHDKKLPILFVEQKEGVVEMDETQVMGSAPLFALLSNKREHIVFCDEKHCDAGIATPCREPRVLDKLGGLHAVGSIGLLSLKELQAVP